jgi:two-component system chemotaxis sensor kinase CheA
VSERLEKVVAFDIVGQDVRVDPERVGHVFASLVHLVRNSLDHGIEPPEERAPKPECAHIAVKCSEDQDGWTVEVTDDGRGIDADAVVEAAVKKGAVDRATAEAMTVDERLRLIFLDSVTTKERATEDSGRGVGMTALLASVEALGGTVVVQSAKGEGTRFRVRVPQRNP